jgi:hypothetical protein
MRRRAQKDNQRSRQSARPTPKSDGPQRPAALLLLRESGKRCEPALAGLCARGHTPISAAVFERSARRRSHPPAAAKLSALSWVALHHLVQSAGRHLQGAALTSTPPGSWPSSVRMVTSDSCTQSARQLALLCQPGRLVVLDAMAARRARWLQRVGRAPGAGQRPTCQIDVLRPSAASASARVRLSQTERELMPG